MNQILEAGNGIELKYYLLNTFIENIDEIENFEDTIVWIFNYMPYKIKNKYYQGIAWVNETGKEVNVDKFFYLEVSDCKNRFKNINKLKRKLFLYIKLLAKQTKDRRFEYLELIDLDKNDRVDNYYGIINEFNVNIECRDIRKVLWGYRLDLCSD